MKRSYFIELNLEEQRNHYCSKITSFKKLESFPDGVRIIDNNTNPSDPVGFIADHDFSYVGKDSFSYEGKTDEDIDRHSRFVTNALRYSVINQENVVVEFDEDSYAKFIYVTKMKNGAYFGAE